MQTVYTLWSEWDIGHEGYVFTSVEEAKQFASTRYGNPDFGFTPGEDQDFEEVWTDLIGFKSHDLLGTLPSPVKGYTPLSAAQVEKMNRVKTQGAALGDLVGEMRSMGDELDQRWLSVGATHLQIGLMALTRSVAKPEFF